MRWGLVAGACALLLPACSAPERERRVPAPPPLASSAAPATVDDEDPLIPLEDLPSATDRAKTREARPIARASFPFLDGEPEGASVSIGDTTHGRLVNARELTESEALHILPRQKERDLKYGTEGLVGLLEHAGRALYEKTKSPLWVGNLGRREGGDIEWSVSHNAGRDADVAFCYKSPSSGAPVDPPDLVQLDRSGVSKDKKLAFDVARTWIVVRSLLSFEGASVQYLFISDPLKKKLLEHAKAIKEPPSVIDMANEVLRQPGSAAAHDDHLHVRIYCSRMDAAGGCHDMGMSHRYAKRFDGERSRAVEKARALLHDKHEAHRRRALLRLGLVGDGSDLEAGKKALRDPSPFVRAAAAEMLASLGSESETSALVARFREESDSAVMAALVDAIGFLGGADAGPFFQDVLLATAGAPVLSFSDRALPLDVGSAARFFGLADDPYPPMRSLLAPTPVVDLAFDRAGLQRLAVRAVRHSGTTEPIGPLIALLDDRDLALANDAAVSLSYLTNQRLVDDDDKRPLGERLREAKPKYEKLFAAQRKMLRDGWLTMGFATRGYKVRGIDRANAWEILRAANDEPHLAFNARSVLVRLLGQPREVIDYGSNDACRMLTGVLWERRGQLGIAKPSEDQRRACWASHGESPSGSHRHTDDVAAASRPKQGSIKIRVVPDAEPAAAD